MDFEYYLITMLVTFVLIAVISTGAYYRTKAENGNLRRQLRDSVQTANSFQASLRRLNHELQLTKDINARLVKGLTEARAITQAASAKAEA